MTGTEFLVVVVAMLLGYWIVSSLMDAKPKKKKATDEADKEFRSQQNSSQQDGQHQGRKQSPLNEEEFDIQTNWFRILNVPDSSGKEEISIAYKQKIRQYHPDKVATLGPELRELAELKSKQINAAYSYAMKLRG